jgi:hypothetical protein
VSSTIAYYNWLIYLDALFRYQVGNMLITTMTAGPTEATADQLQHQVKIVVDDLEVLDTRGVLIKTPRFPQGSKCILLFDTQCNF